MTKKDTMRYVRGFTIPRSIPEGRVLCHNHVQHTASTSCGVNGFRAWTEIKPPPHFVKCPCGYAGLPHYAQRDHVKIYRKDGTLLPRYQRQRDQWQREQALRLRRQMN